MRHPIQPAPGGTVPPESKERRRRRSAKSPEVALVAFDNELARPIVEEDARRIAGQSKITREIRRARKRALQAV